jgi:dolichyl-phosphate-mannose--protein O-mannosyl transferase
MIIPTQRPGPGLSGLWRDAEVTPESFSAAPQNSSRDLRRNRAKVALGLLLVVAIAAFNLYYRLGEPARPIWDESYYLTSTARYELGYAQFASHPPLGLMLIAAGDRFSGANAGADWAPIAADKKVAGEHMPASFSYFGVRSASALFGALAAGLVYLLMAALTKSPLSAVLFTTPFLFDTALIAQFRAAQLDSFQLCFAALALLCLVHGDRHKRFGWAIGFGMACGLAMMVRANGILLLAGMVLPCGRALFAPGGTARALSGCVRHAAAISVAASLTALAALSFHIAISSRPMPAHWAAARADGAFIAPAYRNYLDGKASLSGSVLISAADGYRRFMAADLAGIGRSDKNGSAPLGWLIGQKPIVYRWDSDGRTTAFVALVPNRAAWAVSLFGVVGGLWVMLCGFHTGASAEMRRLAPVAVALLAIWSAFFLSDLLLARMRVMYLYHYFPALLVGWVLAAIAAPLARSRFSAPPAVANVALGAVLLNFFCIAPLALHQPLTDTACSLRTAITGADLCAHDQAKGEE